ncbi:GNAT family N-acetyltransferase [Hymenobacter coccineus]|uniref:GNAT family N-acetyltransferase n=1 Tax=Hymenobacter coccineus TaxID=1908235 RepID=A0A1G1TFN9_9BACT|nr:GNAT family N-acetyltransferase [Hymenobacter coccineus]OGX89692.1 GNAT family N-acetyltransferase [Hymenobacter coccineus]
MPIAYHLDRIPTAEQVIDLYLSAGLERPTHDAPRIAQMYANSNLVATAWDGPLLVGVSRALTDFCFCCYLSDLAVRDEYKHQGIGKQLLALTKEKAGPGSTLMLRAAQEAMAYYPKLGMETMTDGFLIRREH